MPDNSLINFGNIAKPANRLIEKSSDAVGGLFKPWQTRRVAHAEADAMVIRAKADAEAAMVRAENEIQITDLHRRAFHRFIDEEAQKQMNMESILAKAVPDVEEDSNPDNMQNDWIVNFFDKSRLVSDDDMQNLWARILAGEANIPGAFSKKTINIMADLEKDDAILFQTLCRFGWYMGGDSIRPLIYDHQSDIYTRTGIDFGTLHRLETFGLVKFIEIAKFTLTASRNRGSALYFNKQVDLTLPENNTIETGKVMLTVPGQELTQICNNLQPVEGFFEYVCTKWANEGLRPSVTVNI